MTTRVQMINALITKHSLDIPSVAQKDVNLAGSNRLRNLDAGTDRRWRKDNNKEEQAWLLLASICVIRDFPTFELDHHLPKIKGGSNHFSNIFPTPKTLNQAKRAREWTESQWNHLLGIADEGIQEMFEIPSSYTQYLNCKDWLLKTYKS